GLRQIAEQVGHFSLLVRELQESQEADGEDEEEEFDPSQVPDFLSLTQEDAEVTWKWLIKWAGEVLRPNYLGGRRSPWRPCWYLHRRVVLELIWCCACWHWAYSVKKAPPSRAADWATRWLPHLEAFLAKHLEPCGAGETYTVGGKSVARLHRHPEKYAAAFAYPYSPDHQPEPWETDPERPRPLTPLGELVAMDIARRPKAETKTDSDSE
ncbi:hypothetical protein CG736_34795, partial [Kitasatospora sp. CB02891]